MSGFPIQPSKVQRPPLRDDVLSRGRLNDLLDAKSSHRVVLVVAEAGYGKTTMLADWSRRTSRRVLWYRLDADDRDWLGFLHHLVAAGRVVDDRFGVEVEELLGSLGPEGPTREQIVAALARALSAAAGNGLTVILDDYHTVDDREEVRDVLRGLIDRVTDGVSILLATRTDPELPLSRYRARAEVATLTAEDLRFEESETERLFREAYQRPLDADVLVDLNERTEGWAASLQLVRSAISERSQSEIRQFVARLSGARGDLHDYLAEEVVGRLPDELQRFLMELSLLDAVSLELAEVVHPVGRSQVAALLRTSEGVGLLSRRGDGEALHRFHPLVRDFLSHRASIELGPQEVVRLHVEVGDAYDGRDWRIAVGHHLKAGNEGRAWTILNNSIDQVLARGEYNAAITTIKAMGSPVSMATHVLRSRALLQRGEFEAAREAASDAVDMPGPPSQAATALLNASSIMSLTGDTEDGRPFAERAREVAVDRYQQMLADALIGNLDLTEMGSLPAYVDLLLEMREQEIARFELHHLAITNLNLSIGCAWLLRSAEALDYALEAIEQFEASSRGYEQVAAFLSAAVALAQLGRWPEAASHLDSATSEPGPASLAEALTNAAETQTLYGDPAAARNLLEQFKRTPNWTLFSRLAASTRVWLALFDGDTDDVRRALRTFQETRIGALNIGERFSTTLTETRAILRISGLDHQRVSLLWRIATSQASPLQRDLIVVLEAIADGPSSLSRLLAAGRHQLAISILADDVSRHLSSLSGQGLEALSVAVSDRPWRWLPFLRQRIQEHGENALRAAELVARIGSADDIQRLRTAGKSNRRLSRATVYSRHLAQKLASPVRVDDMGRIRIVVGNREFSSDSVRRKVLALLMYLAIQPRMSATRDQVLEALWPDLAPDLALNSLNQTIYFLRRVLDPNYAAQSSAEYVHFEAEAVWLDDALFDLRSHRLRALLTTSIGDEAAHIETVLALYDDRFALEFAYEDWAATYRDSLHVAMLAACERATAQLVAEGDVDRAISVCRRALELDPSADTLELTLLRLYRSVGASAAAAEQYVHYSGVVRNELGIDPPTLDELTDPGADT